MTNNEISVNGEGHIVVQNVTNGNVKIVQEIDPSKPEELKAFIKQSDNELLEDLLKVIENNNQQIVNILYSTRKVLKTRKLLRMATTSTVVLVLILVGLVSIYFVTSNKYSSIFEFSPAWIHEMNTNSELKIHKTEGINNIDSIVWYEYEQDSLIITKPPKKKFKDKDALYYHSKLRANDSWTGFLFTRRYTLQQSFNVLGKKHLIIIASAQKDDNLEIKLKHLYGTEAQTVFKVKSGIAGYKIPLKHFKGIDLSQIQIFLIAHSNSVGSSLENEFYFKYIGFE